MFSKPTGERYTLAARLSGDVSSAFPDGAPGDGDTEGHVDASTGSINVVVVADVDMLADQFWAQVRSFFGQRIVTAWAGNGDFVINALDNLSGSSDLIGIRSRQTYRRPFDRVEELKRQADESFLAKEQELQDQLTLTESKLNDLQTGRDDDNPLVMTAEQSDEVQRFLDERVRIRKELRRVRRDLDRDIENLGTTLKLINIGLIPLLISLGAIGAVVLRARRRRKRVPGMKPHHLGALIAAAVLAVVAGLWTSSVREPETSAIGTPLLPGLAEAVNEVTGCQIDRPR